MIQNESSLPLLVFQLAFEQDWSDCVAPDFVTLADHVEVVFFEDVGFGLALFIEHRRGDIDIGQAGVFGALPGEQVVCFEHFRPHLPTADTRFD